MLYRVMNEETNEQSSKLTKDKRVALWLMTLILILIPMNQTWSVYDSLYVELDVDMRCVDHYKVMV